MKKKIVDLECVESCWAWRNKHAVVRVPPSSTWFQASVNHWHSLSTIGWCEVVKNDDHRWASKREVGKNNSHLNAVGNSCCCCYSLQLWSPLWLRFWFYNCIFIIFSEWWFNKRFQVKENASDEMMMMNDSEIWIPWKMSE